MNLVHNYDTGIYANISMDEGNCTLYKLKFKNPNGTIEQKVGILNKVYYSNEDRV